jgi:PAS domain S-box-containing protein
MGPADQNKLPRNKIFNGVMITDEDGRIEFANQLVHQMFGYRFGYLPGKNIDELFSLDIKRKIKRHFDVTKLNDESAENIMSFQGIREDNTLVSCEINFTLLIDILPEMMLLQIADLTELQSIEKKVFERNNLFLQMANNLPGVVYKYQLFPENKFLYVSDGIKKITGYDSYAFFGKDAVQWEDLIHHPDQNRVTESKRTQLVNLNQFDVNYRLIRKDKSICWVKDQAAGKFDRMGRLTAIEGNILDITDMKSSQYSNYANILDSEDNFKSRIASSINDQLHQTLAMAALQLKEIEKDIQSFSTDTLKFYKTGMKMLNQAIIESRQISFDLIPKSIRDFGLVAAIEDLISSREKESVGDIQFQHDLDGIRLTSFQENNIFFILREIFGIIKRLNNTDNLVIRINRLSEKLTISVMIHGVSQFEMIRNKEKRPLEIISNRTLAIQGEFSLNVYRKKFINFNIQAPLENKKYGED